MRYLLVAINAKYIHSNLGVYSLRAYARKKGSFSGVPIEIGEYTINHSLGSILKDIYRRKPEVIGFSCYIWNIGLVKELLSDLPKILPQAKIWLGGPEVSYHGEAILEEFPQVSGIMAGEGEETFCRLVQFYEASSRAEALEEIPGILYRSAGDLKGTKATEWKGIRRTAPGSPLDLSSLPFPYEDWEEERWQEFQHRIVYYESSRGCPFSCSYCLSSIDKRVRFRDLSLVKREMQFFLDRKVRQVKFVDRTFNCKKSHAMEIWKYLEEHDNGVTNVHFEIGADCLDEEEIALLHRMRPGFIQLEIGVQTTNPDTIREIRRTMDLEKVARMTAMVRAGGNIHQHLDLIAGLPLEDLESFRRSFDQVYQMRPHQLQLGFLKVLKGSYMDEQKKVYQLQFTHHPPYEVLSTRWLSFDDVMRLKQVEEMVEVHYNSDQFRETLRCLEALFPRPIQIFEAMADWYEEKNLWDVSHSRQARYEILLEWIKEQYPQKIEEIRDALTMDVYLREKAKSRPAFARDLSRYKEGFRRFYREEEQKHSFLKGYEGYDSRQLERMTHIEVLSDGQVLLFDYQNRDPLSHNAAVVELSGQSLWKEEMESHGFLYCH